MVYILAIPIEGIASHFHLRGLWSVSRAPCPLLSPAGRMGDYYGIDGDDVPVQGQDYIPPAEDFAVRAAAGHARSCVPRLPLAFPHAFRRLRLPCTYAACCRVR